MINSHNQLSNEELVCFKYKFVLPNNVTASLIFDSSSTSSQINYDYEYQVAGERRNRSKLVVKQRVHLNYQAGVITDTLNVSFEIINPENKGKEFFLGADISPNSHMFLDIDYKRNGDGNFEIFEVRKGVTLLYSSDENEKNQLIKIAESPVDIETIIECKYGKFDIPLAMSDAKERLFINISENHST